jgi:RNA polymerase sigma-70 factor (ECF subfamily)
MIALVDSDPVPLDFRADVYEPHLGHVWRSLRRLGVVERDLEDAAHEVFVIAYRRLADFEVGRPVRPWLTGIAWRVAADERRRARHRRERMPGDASLATRCAEGLSPEAACAQQQARDLVARALDTLDLDRRVVFVMAELDGASGPEIAVALEVPLNTVYSRLRVARQRFAASVRRLQLGGDHARSNG